MPDYKKMYFDLFRATEAAIGTLIEAQQRCEEMLLEEPEPPLVLLPKQDRRDQRRGAFCSSMVGVWMLHHRFIPVIFPPIIVIRGRKKQTAAGLHLGKREI